MRIAVVGAGVVGLTTAYALLRQGCQVELLEQRDAVALETSFANGGQLSYRYVSPLADAGVPLQAIAWMFQGNDAPLRFRPQLRLDQWRWCLRFLAACRRSVNQRNAAHLLRLSLHSQKILHDWRASDALNGFAWRANGKLVIYRNTSSLEKAKHGLSAEQRALTAQQCLDIEPALAGMAEHLRGGVFSEGDEVGDCYLFCQQLLQRMHAMPGFSLRTGVRVTGVRLDNGRARALHSSAGELDFNHLVVTAGASSVQLLKPLGVHLPIYPLKGYSLTLPLTNHASVPQTNVTDYDKKVVYARLDDQLRVAAMVDVGGWDSRLDAGRIAKLRETAQNSFPHAGDYQQAKAWAGLRPATPEGTPLLGRTGIDNLWLNAGHGALGFTLACGSADVLAQLLTTGQSAIALDGFKLTD